MEQGAFTNTGGGSFFLKNIQTMKKINMIFLYLCLLTTVASSQSFTLLGDKTFGTSGYDWRPFITYLGDDLFVITGSSNMSIDGDKTDPICDTVPGTSGSDIWILKIDTAFNILWDYSIGGSRLENWPAQIQSLSDGKFIMVSNSISNISCEKSENNRSFPSANYDYWVCMFDASGTLLWEKTYGGVFVDEYVKIKQLSGGEFIVCGLSAAGISGDITVHGYGGYDYWVLKLDSMGNKVWDNVYGGNLNEHQNFFMLADSNNNFLIAGTTWSDLSGTITDTSRGNWDIWLVKIDSDGVVLFDKRYGGTHNDQALHLIQTADGYMICGVTKSPQGLDVSEAPLGVGNAGEVDVWIVKLDTSGNKIWDKRYGGNGLDEGKWIEHPTDGGFIVAATIESDSSGHISEPSYGGRDYWIFKIDSSGTLLWEKRFGGPGDDIAQNFIILPDSSIYLFGQGLTGTSAVKTDPGKGGEDYWLVRFKYDENATGINEDAPALVSIYPNPSTGFIHIPETLFGYKLEAIDVTGRVTHEVISLQSTNLDLGFLPRGFYLLKLEKGESVFHCKLILH